MIHAYTFFTYLFYLFFSAFTFCHDCEMGVRKGSRAERTAPSFRGYGFAVAPDKNQGAIPALAGIAVPLAMILHWYLF